MLTRPKLSVTVVKAPTMSYSPAARASCSAQAESLPLDQAIRAFGKARPFRVGMVSNFFLSGRQLARMQAASQISWLTVCNFDFGAPPMNQIAMSLR